MFKNIFRNFSILTTVNFVGVYFYIKIKQKSSSKLNIVFDLDETIAHTEKQHIYNDFNKSNIIKPDIINILSDSTHHIQLDNSKNQQKIYSTSRVVWIRPGVQFLLPIISKFNNVYLFTKATKPYTDEILSRTNLDKYFIGKKYRDECSGTCKDLQKFKLSLSNSILIDDKRSNNCEKQNFYHIPRYNCYLKYDFEFVKLFGYILYLNMTNDIKNIFNKYN